MDICEFCKWWGKCEDEYDNRSGQIPGGEDHKPCYCPSVGGGSYSDESRMVGNALNSYESIGTGPLFGCVHFEEFKEK